MWRRKKKIWGVCCCCLGYVWKPCCTTRSTLYPKRRGRRQGEAVKRKASFLTIYTLCYCRCCWRQSLSVSWAFLFVKRHRSRARSFEYKHTRRVILHAPCFNTSGCMSNTAQESLLVRSAWSVRPAALGRRVTTVMTGSRWGPSSWRPAARTPSLYCIVVASTNTNLKECIQLTREIYKSKCGLSHFLLPFESTDFYQLPKSRRNKGMHGPLYTRYLTPVDYASCFQRQSKNALAVFGIV